MLTVYLGEKTIEFEGIGWTWNVDDQGNLRLFQNKTQKAEFRSGFWGCVISSGEEKADE